MFAAAPWAQGAARILELPDEAYYRKLARRILDGLDASGQEIQLLFVSMFPMSGMPTGAGRTTGRRQGPAPHHLGTGAGGEQSGAAEVPVEGTRRLPEHELTAVRPGQPARTRRVIRHDAGGESGRPGERSRGRRGDAGGSPR